MFARKYFAFVLLVVCFSVVGAINAQPQCQPPTPSASNQRPNIFTEAQEVDLGDAIAEQIQHNYKVIDDDAVTANLNRIGQRIIKHLVRFDPDGKKLFVLAASQTAYVLDVSSSIR